MIVDPNKSSIKDLHAILLSAISPRPIALVSTVDENGNDNLSPFSFFNVFSANPPIAIFSPARRGKENTTKHTYENAKINPQVVINVVSYDIVEQMSLSSCDFSKGESEFIKAGFTPIASDLVKPKRVKESPVQLECKVIEVKELGSEGGAGNLVFCEVLRIHINQAIVDENGKINPDKIKLVGRMGGNWYCKAFGESIFEINKPIGQIGIGFESIPKDILCSKTLSGNDLGKLAGVEALPEETEVNEYKLLELSEIHLKFDEDGEELEKQLHLKAKQLIENNKIWEAWKTLLSFNL